MVWVELKSSIKENIMMRNLSKNKAWCTFSTIFQGQAVLSEFPERSTQQKSETSSLLQHPIFDNKTNKKNKKSKNK